MPQYLERDLSDQYISLSYQDILQQYPNTSSILYVLDGYGNVVFGIPTASIGYNVITSDITASLTFPSASYSLTASYAMNGGGGSSYLPTYNTASIMYTGPQGQLSTASYYNNMILVATIVFLYDINGVFTGSNKIIY